MKSNDQIIPLPGERISFTRMRIIKGKKTEVLFHYYPIRHKLFAVAGGHLKLALCGELADDNFNKHINDRGNQEAAAS